MSTWGRCKCGAFLSAFEEEAYDGPVEDYYVKCMRPGCKYQEATDIAYASQWDGFADFVERLDALEISLS